MPGDDPPDFIEDIDCIIHVIVNCTQTVIQGKCLGLFCISLLTSLQLKSNT